MDSTYDPNAFPSDTASSTEDADLLEKQRQEEEDKEIVQAAQDFYSATMAATTEWRAVALEDLEFLAGEQWDENVKQDRANQGRPALTVNRLPQFVRQITNEQRQAKPSITVNPVDDSSDIRTAEVLQGVIRNIEYSSNADAAYAAGGQSAAITGLGYWDVSCEFEDERSFEQRIVIKRIPNPLSVLMDLGAKELAGDDARQAIITTDITVGEWKARFPDVEPPKGGDWGGRGNAMADWVAKDGVRLHEYRYVKDEPDTLIQNPDGGEPVFATELATIAAVRQEETTGVPVSDEQFDELVKGAINRAKALNLETRQSSRRKACWVRIAGDEIVERGEFAGKYLQLVRVVGGELEINGRTIYEGVVRHAKDSQRMLNYFVSSEAEAIALTPKAPFIGTAAQFDGHEAMWSTANSKTHAFLVFNVDPAAPTLMPQRVMAEANVQAITNARMQAADDLKGTTGIYDGQLGARSNETSGKAILARQSQGQTANFHFTDNRDMAIRYTGRICVDLIPKIYGQRRMLRILGEDGKPEMVPVNQDGQDNQGQPIINLNAGRFDVAVSSGPPYQSRRQEAAAQLLELIRVNPAVSQVAGDLLVKAMDIPGGNEIAKRMKALLPPQLQEPEGETPPAQALMQQLQQQGQLVEQLTQQLNAVSEDLTKALEGTEAKERLEMTKLRVQLALKLAELESKEGVEMLRLEHRAIGQRQQMTGFNEPIPGATEGG